MRFSTKIRQKSPYPESAKKPLFYTFSGFSQLPRRAAVAARLQHQWRRAQPGPAVAGRKEVLPPPQEQGAGAWRRHRQGRQRPAGEALPGPKAGPQLRQG